MPSPPAQRPATIKLSICLQTSPALLVRWSVSYIIFCNILFPLECSTSAAPVRDCFLRGVEACDQAPVRAGPPLKCPLQHRHVTQECSASSQGRSRYRNTYIMLISLEEKLPRQMFKYYYFRPTLQVRLGSVSAPSSPEPPGTAARTAPGVMTVA